MSEYGPSNTAQYTDLSDDDLDKLVTGIQDQFPMCGNRKMHGHYCHMGLECSNVQSGSPNEELVLKKLWCVVWDVFIEENTM